MKVTATHSDRFIQHYLAVKTREIPNISAVYEASRSHAHSSTVAERGIDASTNLGRCGNGDVEIEIRDVKELASVIGPLRQAFARQIGNGDPEA